MIVKGYTVDGCQIQQTHGGLHIETGAQRDSRLAAKRLSQIERTGPELLFAAELALAWMMMREADAGPEDKEPMEITGLRAAIAKATL